MSLVEKTLRKLRESTPAKVGSAGDAQADSQPKGYVRRPIGKSAKVATVDVDRLRQAGLLAPIHQERELSHQYRTIKRPLIKRAFDRREGEGALGALPRSIMISSALPGEGKTFTSVNLALSMAAEVDHSVLLVDGDVAKPHISETFGLADEPGLLDVLDSADRSIESVIVNTDVPGLSILPVGRRSIAATELLASARMQKIVRQLEQLDSQGIVLFDSPPILLTTEARVLASLFGQVLLVVGAGSTPQQAVLDAIQIIGDEPFLQLVLNQAVYVGASSAYYGYGYGYGEARSEVPAEGKP